MKPGWDVRLGGPRTEAELQDVLEGLARLDVVAPNTLVDGVHTPRELVPVALRALDAVRGPRAEESDAALVAGAWCFETTRTKEVDHASPGCARGERLALTCKSVPNGDCIRAVSPFDCVGGGVDTAGRLEPSRSRIGGERHHVPAVGPSAGAVDDEAWRLP